MADAIVENLFLVNAPAGSGKTTWIRKNVRKYLLQNPNDNVLCITYTNRAAEELGKDVDSNRVYFGTIHSFINDFIGSFFSHESILELYWEVYKNQIVERIENISQKADTYISVASIIDEELQAFTKKNETNPYYIQLLKVKMDKYFGKKNVTNVKECLKEGTVYGPLCAYRLFYVGCSRAKRNLVIMINKKDIEGFEDKLRNKLMITGFNVL